MQTSKAGVAVGKLRSSTSPAISTLAKEVVKLWKEAIESAKQKRKRDDGEDVKKEDSVKRTKGGSESSSFLPDLIEKGRGADADSIQVHQLRLRHYLLPPLTLKPTRNPK